MGLGLLLLTAGAFVRFVVGRYAGVHGAYDVPATALMALGVVSMAAAWARHALGDPRLVRRTAPPRRGEEEPS